MCGGHLAAGRRLADDLGQRVHPGVEHVLPVAQSTSRDARLDAQT